MRKVYYFIILITISVLIVLSCKTIENTAPKNNQTIPITLVISGITGVTSTFDQATNTYTFTVPTGTNIKALALAFTLPTGAIASPASGSTQDFTNPVTYTITAEDGTIIKYTIKVVVQGGVKSSAKQIFAFSFDELNPVVKANINQSTFEITAEVPAMANLKALKPTITLSDKATVSPVTGVSQDFTNAVKYTVTAEDGSKQEYNVKISQSGSTNSLIISIPDPLFEKVLVDKKIDKDNKVNGEIATVDALAITELEVNLGAVKIDIKSLKGIEGFKNLKILLCNKLSLTTLDISQNTALEKLYCHTNTISSLNLSNNINLKHLYCSLNKLTELDVSKSTNLNVLSCSENSIKNLDVSRNLKLMELFCDKNGIEAINLKNNINLTKLGIDLKGTSLDVRSNTNLEELYCGGVTITDLDVSKNAKLNTLYCNKANLTNLDLSNNVNLEYLYCNENQLSNLNLSNNKKLYRLDCSNNLLSKLDLSNNSELGILDCRTNTITTLDLSKNLNLIGVGCSYNKITVLDVSKNLRISTLWCTNNLISSLDISKNLSLVDLECTSNPNLKTITINKNIKFSRFLYDSGVTIIKVD